MIGRETKIEHPIMISGRFKNALLSAKSYPGADCYSDHALVLAKFRLKLKKNKKKPMNTKLNLAILRSDQDIRQKYALSGNKRLPHFLNKQKQCTHELSVSSLNQFVFMY